LIYDVVVVGSGFSAIAMVCNLLELLPREAKLAVIGDDPGFGRGTAYRSELYLHRLNVPAGRMSLFPDRPDDFAHWLKSRDIPLQQGDFAKRSDYGLYLRDTLARLLRRRSERCSVEFIRAKATGCVEQYNGTLAFQLHNGDQIAGRHIVLCLGVGSADLPVDTSRLPSSVRSRVVDNPWRLSWMNRVKPQDPVCILGSGLTMIDQVLGLRSHGHRGQITVLSRRGLAPHPHTAQPVAPATIDAEALPPTVSGILSELRRRARGERDWRAVMEGVRPFTQKIWQNLPPAERSRFLRHALPWWSIHRHRIAPDVFSIFDPLVKDGTLRFQAGFIKSLEEADGDVMVGYRRRGSQVLDVVRTRWLVNCTGMERAGIKHSPLLKEMSAQELIKPDPLGLGIQVNGESRVSGAARRSSADLFVVGALAAGQFWEITAVPDIRVQARKVAETIASDRRVTTQKIDAVQPSPT
jgi:uncharacterized NAD(P)/FAD-binding protein YdhS